MALIVASSVAILLYLLLISVFIRGWNRIALLNPIDKGISSRSISLIICVRNEAYQLPVLIEALKRQTTHEFELVWVDDHSEDNSRQIMESTRAFFSKVQIIHSSGRGKKAAQAEGIMVATGSLILTTDADCLPHEAWVETMLRYFVEHPADLLIGPVKLIADGSWLSRLQQLDFLTLVASGMGAAGAGLPIFCNGANMAFSKQQWMDSRADLHEEELSGDDVFLLHSIKRRGGRIVVVKSAEAMVLTPAKATLKAFLNQRRRWASKRPQFNDPHLLFTALIVSAVNLLMPVLLIAALFDTMLWSTLFVLFLSKLAIDGVFLLELRSFFQVRLSPVLIVLFAMVYPLYVVVGGLTALVRKQKSW